MHCNHFLLRPLPMYRADTFRSKTVARSARYIDNGFFLLAMIRVNNIITGEFNIDTTPKRGNFKDLSGMRFGSLLVLGLSEITKKSSYWFCKCDCGNIVRVRSSGFKQNKLKSCSCSYAVDWNDDGIRAAHSAWNAMLQRCTNVKNKHYHDYGGRGITVCDRWLKFKNFIEDMGPRPERGLTFDRIDNNKGYCKENCRWATWTVQANNKRNNHYLTHDGISLTVSQWSKRLGIERQVIQCRITLGWTTERALTYPVVRRKKKK